MLTQIEEGYDWVLAYFGSASAEELREVVDFVGGRRLPRWRTGTYWIEHAMWTQGTIVPYLRAHGVTPPAIAFF